MFLYDGVVMDVFVRFFYGSVYVSFVYDYCFVDFLFEDCCSGVFVGVGFVGIDLGVYAGVCGFFDVGDVVFEDYVGFVFVFFLVFFLLFVFVVGFVFFGVMNFFC